MHNGTTMGGLVGSTKIVMDAARAEISSPEATLLVTLSDKSCDPSDETGAGLPLRNWH